MMNLLPRLNEAAKVSRLLRAPDGGADLRVLPDRVGDLPVEDESVGDDDDRVEDGGVVPREPDQLVGQPSDGIALATARRVLDQVAPARPVHRRVGQEPADDIELVVTRPNLLPGLLAGFPLHGLHDDLGIVLQDIGQALAGQDFPPKVIRLDSVGVRRVAGAVVPALVEGQEVGRLALEVRAEAHLALVHREVSDAAAELKQLLARVAVLLVLLDRVRRRLLGEAVLQLEGENWQAVDE